MNKHREVEPHARSTAAHQDSVVEPTEYIVARLRKEIGTNLLAHLVDDSVSAVNKWASGSSRPPRESERALRTLFQVLSTLSENDGTHVLRPWLIGFNPQLADDTPADAIRDGRFRETLAAARAFSIGG